jgi:hypothetical protein
MLKEIYLDFKEFGAWVKHYMFYWRHSLKMNLAIRMADIKQKAFNKQYHIMLIELPNGARLTSVNNEEIRMLKHKKWLPKHLSMVELKQSIFYSTPSSRNNKSTPEERKEAKRKYLAVNCFQKFAP